MANPLGNSVTELSAATGALVKVIRGPGYGFDGPSAITSDGTDIWVANLLGNPVTELSAVTGERVRIIANVGLRLRRPLGHYLGRRPRLGGELLRQFGHRALGIERCPGPES